MALFSSMPRISRRCWMDASVRGTQVLWTATQLKGNMLLPLWQSFPLKACHTLQRSPGNITTHLWVVVSVIYLLFLTTSSVEMVFESRYKKILCLCLLHLIAQPDPYSGSPEKSSWIQKMIPWGPYMQCKPEFLKIDR